MNRVALALLVAISFAPAGPAPILEGRHSSVDSAVPESAESPPVPKITEYHLPPDLYRKAHLFSRLRLASRCLGVAAGPLVLWLILRRRLSARFRDWSEAVSRRRFVQAFVFTPLVALTASVLLLPLDLFDQSLLRHYGVSVQSWGSWAGDWAKVQFLVCLIGSLLVWILYAVIRKSPRRWWLGFWFASLPIFLLIFFLEPFVIDPMFNRFEPLRERAPQLIPRLEGLVRRAGLEIPPDRMFWMEASNKSVVPNAYVTGIGASKRIVVWDTAIAQETPDGILMVFAHEMGHYVLGHVWLALAFFALMAFAVLYGCHRAVGRLLARSAGVWGVRGLDDWASLPAILLLLALFGFAAGVLGNAFSRYQENQADIYSLEVAHGLVPDPGQASAVSFQKFGERVFVDPDPNRVGVFLFYDHPTVRDRIHLFVTYDPWGKGERPRFLR
jgi:Zn-dependent protease with chaperone function